MSRSPLTWINCATVQRLMLGLSGTSGKVVVPVAIVRSARRAGGRRHAYFTSQRHRHRDRERVGTLNPPTGVAAAARGSTVTVSWAAPVSGVTPQGYDVTRTNTGNSSTANACATTPPPSPTLTAGPSCSDTGVPDGTYTYTVTAVYHSWTATSAASASVTVNAVATKLVFTTSPQTLVTGQLSGTITVQRENA